MKKFLIALLLLPSLAWGEEVLLSRMNPYILGSGVAAAAKTTASQNFYTSSAVDPITTPWAEFGSMQDMRIQTDGGGGFRLRCIASQSTCGIYRTDMTSISEQQYSAVRMLTGYDNYTGASVRVQSGATTKYYGGIFRSLTTAKIVKVNDTTVTELSSCSLTLSTSTDGTDGSLLGIKASGTSTTTLQLTLDGVDQTGDGCSVQDSTSPYTSGYVGIASNLAEGEYLYWEGGEW